MQILDSHKAVLGKGPGTLKGTKAKTHVDPNAEPKYMKARPVPYTPKVKVELELDRPQSVGITSPVEFTEWATPIVPVVKSNGSVRICGMKWSEVKCTVNQVSKFDNYPIPKRACWRHLVKGTNSQSCRRHTSNCYWRMSLRSIQPSIPTKDSNSTTDYPSVYSQHRGYFNAAWRICSRAYPTWLHALTTSW